MLRCRKSAKSDVIRQNLPTQTPRIIITYKSLVVNALLSFSLWRFIYKKQWLMWHMCCYVHIVVSAMESIYMELPTQSVKEVLTESEVAILVSVSARTLQRARLQGKPIFPVFMVGSAPRYSRALVLEKICSGTKFDAPQTTPESTQELSAMRTRGRPRTNQTRK